MVGTPGRDPFPSIVRLLRSGGIATLIQLGRSSGRGRRMTVATANDLARQMSRNRASRMAVAFAAARSFDSRSWLPNLRVPTLVIVGEADRMVSSGQSRFLIDGIPGVRLRTVPSAGHMLPLSHPEEFARIVAAWLAEVDGRTTIRDRQASRPANVVTVERRPAPSREHRLVDSVPSD